MKKLLFLLVVVSTPSYANFTIDLTKPENSTIANSYPKYEAIRSINFNDTNGKSSVFGLKSKKAIKAGFLHTPHQFQTQLMVDRKYILNHQ